MQSIKYLLAICILLGIIAIPNSWIRKAGAEEQINDIPTVMQMIWNSTMQTNDVAVSGNGLNVVAVNGSGLFYFSWNSSTPKWWYSPVESTLLSVAVSSDADYVVTGDTSGHIYYFNESMSRTGEQSSPTWESSSLGGSIDRGTLDMSADGENVVLGGTGYNFYYFAQCTTRATTNEYSTWGDYLSVSDYHTVHISPDGQYVATGGTWFNGTGFVAFYANANSTPHPTHPNWIATTQLNNTVTDLALSDDGFAVVAVAPYGDSLAYWANATTLTADPQATWTAEGYFSVVDMSGNGQNVTAGGPMVTGLYFWGNSTTRQGLQLEDWGGIASENVLDVAISQDGNVIVASALPIESLNYSAYFYNSAGELLGEFTLLQQSFMVSISDNGNLAAVAGPGWDSLYVFIPEFTAIMLLMLILCLTALAIAFSKVKPKLGKTNFT
jgi:hypothetical protein